MSVKKEICLMGGLGNQLFQFAFGRYMTGYGQDELILDISHKSLRKGESGLPEISEMLGQHVVKLVDSEFDVISEKVRNYAIRLSTHSSNGWSFARAIVEKSLETSLNGLVPKRYEKKKVLLARGIDDSGLFERNPIKDFYIIGYFQTQEYFSAIREYDNETTDRWKRFVIESSGRWRYLKPKSSVILHLRRGDYRNSSFGVLSNDYYKSALERIAKVTNFNRVYAISDEYDSVLQGDLKDIAKDIEFIPTHELTSHEVLGLLSQFGSFVGANSSLSWWSAALGGLVQENTVVFPEPWFRFGHSASKLMLPQWIKLDGDSQLWSNR